MTVLGEMIWNDGWEAGNGRRLINQICRKLKKGRSPQQIAEELEEELSEVIRICEVAKKCAPEYDSEKIYALLKEA